MKSLQLSVPVLTFAIAISMAVASVDSVAADKKAPKDNALHGKISAVDKEAKTITVNGKAVTVDDTTVITDAGKPTKLENLKLGSDTTISTFMLGEKLIAVSIKTGVVVVALPPAAKKKK